MTRATWILLAAIGFAGLAASCSESTFSSANAKGGGTDGGTPCGSTGTSTNTDNAGDDSTGTSTGTSNGTSTGSGLDDAAPCTNPGGPSQTSTPPGGGQCTGGNAGLTWDGPEKSCIVDQGKTYNFDLNACAEMRKAQFDCSWTSVIAELTKRSLLTDTLKTDSANGSKLVSCGQSQDGNRIVVQWIKLTDGAGDVQCGGTAGSHHITTGCYTVYVNSSAPPTPTDEDEKRKQVFDCMNQL